MAEEYDPGYENKGFSKVYSLAEAKEIMDNLKVPYAVICEQLFMPKTDRFGRVYKDKGIHIYFMNHSRTMDYGYYTPITNSLIINKEPRRWNIKANLVEV